MNTYKKKLIGEKIHEAVKIKYINMSVILVKIRKGEIIVHVQSIENIILYKHHKTPETLKSYKALLTEKPITERNKRKEKIQENLSFSKY